MIIDARGELCPMPVIKAKNALKTEEGKNGITVSVDNVIATENLGKLAKERGYGIEVNKINDEHYDVIIKKDPNSPDAAPVAQPVQEQPLSGGTLVMIDSNIFGRGDDELGKALMKGFIFTLTEMDTAPERIIFCNSGAKIPVQGSEALESLKKLEALGTEILTCGTCLNFFGLTEQLAIGSVTNMYTIVDSLQKAAKIIKV